MLLARECKEHKILLGRNLAQGLECDICASAKIDLSLPTTRSGKVDWTFTTTRTKPYLTEGYENLYCTIC